MRLLSAAGAPRVEKRLVERFRAMDFDFFFLLSSEPIRSRGVFQTS
jgi:hypothetical protein